MGARGGIQPGGLLLSIDNVCTHDGGDLAGGVLDDNEIVCPRHGARFNVRAGAATAAPA